MNSRLAVRRLALPVFGGSLSPSVLVASTKNGLFQDSGHALQRRHKWSVNLFGNWGAERNAEKAHDPRGVASELDDPKKRKEFLQKNMRGRAEDNIFQDEIEAETSGASGSDREVEAPQKTKQSIAMVTDPDPRSRIFWHRRKVIQMVRKNGMINRAERIKMTEREFVHKSYFLPTSVKKLVMLARQIDGKPVDEAIMQMKWSKKKMAAEVKYYLEEAKDLAIAQRGMGLGQVNNEIFDKPRKVKTRQGKWAEITDPSRIYVAQSWVGRGPWRNKTLDYKGRGRTGIMQHPSASFTVVLKEERTRIREHEEREAKKARKGPWVHLPNRPIYGQRPYYSW